MSLRIILNQFQIVLLAKDTDLFRKGYATIEMDYHDTFSLRGNMLLYLVYVDLEMFPCGFDQYRNKIVGSNCQDGGDVSIGRNDDFVAIVHDA